MFSDASYLTPDFVFPEYAAVPGDDSYIPYNNVPQGVNHYKGRLFITMPRRSPGVPSTLNYIDLKQTKSGDSPRLKSYPNAEINSLRVSTTLLLFLNLPYCQEKALKL